ncbi:hypothetical protein [Sulfurivermis fontis]|jgi:hypothetical protein|uniref:hypothetical protein n=1 Tax=Sulfurivermis fontis TaxID=1972068 RepID=UPI0018D5A2DF|nr:hypothetical protein [Sulfurivermis fontis]
MTSAQDRTRLIATGLLTAVALVLLVAIYYTPTWWVSLKAPNYPEESFPDGVRIHFHMNGVFNGCTKVEKAEIQEEEALDCVHEMDTINHYVGMYPIAAGGPVEKAYSQFLMALLGVMVIGFVLPSRNARLGVMAVGFAIIVTWMYLTIYGKDGIYLQNAGYIDAMIASLDQEKGGGAEQDDGTAEAMSSGQAIIEQLRRSMQETKKDKPTQQLDASASDKERYIHSLRVSFEIDQKRKESAQEWNGSGFQVMSWHYEKNLGRYFNNPEEIKPMVDTLQMATHLLFAGIIGAMGLLLWGARQSRGFLYWVLALAPMALPVFFIIEYAAWLWWFGHSLHEMAAFTVKPFMPTVFGDGKVAQFSTHSYPHIGFGLMLLFSAVMAAIALLRRKQIKAENAGGM